MLANNSNDSIPAWKLPLLERRRQQAEFERQSVVDDSARLAQMPAWKREVYLKKSMQKKDDARSSENLSVHAAELARKPAFRNPRSKTANELAQNQERSRTRDSSELELTSDSDLSDSERLIPIQRNPILQSDLQRRFPVAQNHASNNKPVDQSSTGTKNSTVFCNGNGYSTSPESNFCRQSGKKKNNKDRDIDEQEEVTYGRGFVSKLLGRFKELSEKNHVKMVASNVPKRSCSSENLLNDSLYDDSIVRSRLTVGNLKYAKGKAQSMENLATLSAEEKTESLSHNGRPLSVANGFVPVVTPNVSHGSERTGKKTLAVSLTSKSREQVNDGVKGSTPSTSFPSAVVHKTPNVSPSGKQTGKETLAVSFASKSREPAKDDGRRNSLSATDPSEVVRETSPRPEDELPKSNIVLLTRTVFESIGTSPPIDTSNSKRGSSLLTGSKTDDIKTEQSWQRPGSTERIPVLDMPDGSFSNGFNSNATANKTSPPSRANAVVDMRHTSDRTGFASADRTSREVDLNVEPKNLEQRSNKAATSSVKSENSSVPASSRNTPDAVTLSLGTRESLVDSSPSPQTALSGISKFEKPTDAGRNGLIFGKTGPSSSQAIQSRIPNGDSLPGESLSDNLSSKTETTRQHLNLNLTDLPVLPQASVLRNNRPPTENTSTGIDNKNKKKGPGSLLIRPASNQHASSTKVEYLNLTKYNDVKTGDFAPPKKRPSYYDDDEDDNSNISTVPVTNLDDIMDDDDARFSPKEGDPSFYKSHAPSFEFEGAGVRFGRSLLDKSKNGKQMRIHFDDTAEQTFEYPSEQSMIEEWIDGEEEEEEEEDERRIERNSSLKQTPGIGSSGTLASYKSRLKVDYEIGMERHDEVSQSEVASSSLSSKDDVPDDDMTLVSDDTATWSSSASSDLLF